MKYLVTGNAGFIGFHTAKTLLERGHSVVGFDSVNDYYDPQLKEDRLKILDDLEGDYHFYRANLADKSAVDECFKNHQFDRVIHLAAQAGVRHSMEHPEDYVESNLIAFTNILEACRYAKTPHGGGEGKTSGGRHPVTPWGKPTKGAKTCSKKKVNKLVLRTRHQAKKRKG